MNLPSDFFVGLGLVSLGVSNILFGVALKQTGRELRELEMRVNDLEDNQ